MHATEPGKYLLLNREAEIPRPNILLILAYCQNIGKISVNGSLTIVSIAQQRIYDWQE
jgi:hypothetical protein